MDSGVREERSVGRDECEKRSKREREEEGRGINKNIIDIILLCIRNTRALGVHASL